MTPKISSESKSTHSKTAFSPQGKYNSTSPFKGKHFTSWEMKPHKIELFCNQLTFLNYFLAKITPLIPNLALRATK